MRIREAGILYHNCNPVIMLIHGRGGSMTIMKGCKRISVAKFCNGISDICNWPRAREKIINSSCGLFIINFLYGKGVSYNGLGQRYICN